MCTLQTDRSEARPDTPDGFREELSKAVEQTPSRILLRPQHHEENS